MNLSTAFDGDSDGPDLLKPFDMGENISCAGRTRRQPEPGQQTMRTAVP
jgi:hypothetical protein